MSGEQIEVQGVPVAQPELLGALTKARGAAKLLRIDTPDGYDEGALALLLATASQAGFERVNLEHDWRVVTVPIGSEGSAARFVAWTVAGNLVVLDMSAPDPTKPLGPFTPAQVESGELEAALEAACANGACSVELQLGPGDASDGIWALLERWARVTAGVPALSYKVAAVTWGATAVSGRLPPVVIQRIVRSNFKKLRQCYEAGLGRNADLTGRVTARFVIGRDGKVSNVSDGGSDLPDPEVVSCTLKEFYGFAFPAPAGGIVTVVYPIMFATD